MSNLFTNLSHFTDYLPGESNLSLAVLNPRVEDVVGKYIVPVMSESLYETVTADLDSETAIEEPTKGLIKRMRKAAVHLTMAVGAPDFNVRASNGGFTVGEGERVNIASAERVRQYVETRSNDAQYAMDDLIAYLDKHASDTVFIGYLGSAEQRAQYVNFVNDTATMHKYLVTRPGRWVFEQLRTTIEYVEQKYVLPVLCDDLFAHLKNIIAERTKGEDGNLDFGVYMPLMRHIERAVSHYALAYGLNELGLKVTADGGVYRSFYKNANEPNQSSAPTETSGNKQYEFNMKMGGEALSSLKAELMKNATNYPLYAESDCYVLGDKRSAHLDIEEQTKGGLNLIGVK